MHRFKCTKITMHFDLKCFYIYINMDSVVLKSIPQKVSAENKYGRRFLVSLSVSVSRQLFLSAVFHLIIFHHFDIVSSMIVFLHSPFLCVCLIFQLLHTFSHQYGRSSLFTRAASYRPHRDTRVSPVRCFPAMFD